jgi:hypothetical protein
VKEQVDSERVEFGQKADQVLKAPAQSIDGPSHDHLKLSAGRCSAERVEGGALVSTLRAADAMVLVDLDNLPAHPGGDFAKLTFLIGGGLVEG